MRGTKLARLARQLALSSTASNSYCRSENLQSSPEMAGEKLDTFLLRLLLFFRESYIPQIAEAIFAPDTSRYYYILQSDSQIILLPVYIPEVIW